MCAVPRVLLHRWALFAHRTLTRVRQPWSTPVARARPAAPKWALGSACYRRSTLELASTRGASTCAGHWPRHSCDFYASRLRVVSRECFGGRLPFRPLPGSTSLFSVATDAPNERRAFVGVGCNAPGVSRDASRTVPPLRMGTRAVGPRLRSHTMRRRMPDVCPALAFLRARFISPGRPLYDARRGFANLRPPLRVKKGFLPVAHGCAGLAADMAMSMPNSWRIGLS